MFTKNHSTTDALIVTVRSGDSVQYGTAQLHPQASASRNASFIVRITDFDPAVAEAIEQCINEKGLLHQFWSDLSPDADVSFAVVAARSDQLARLDLLNATAPTGALIHTEDGYRFRAMADGSISDGDMSFPALAAFEVDFVLSVPVYRTGADIPRDGTLGALIATLPHFADSYVYDDIRNLPLGSNVGMESAAVLIAGQQLANACADVPHLIVAAVLRQLNIFYYG